jgi:23S rRNA (adenine2503-C2)-methyltransferase
MTIALDLSTSPTARPAPAGKISLVGLSKSQMAARLVEAGIAERDAKMRASQLWNWIYVNGVTDFDRMTNIQKGVRAQLGEKFQLDRPEIVSEQVSSDGTRKWLFRYRDAANPRLPPVEIETVYIPEEDRGTLCVSSQVGCTLTCSFCHTGTQRLVRNLTAGEILGQILMARARLGDFPGGTRPNDGGLVPSGDTRAITNVVMMGMGEPLYNYDNVKQALLIASDEAGISLSKRRITLSTSGVVPQIEPTGREIGVMLAISLHAVRNDLRDMLVPINKKYPLEELLAACRYSPGLSNARRITFE